MLLDPKLHVLGPVPNAPEVAVDALDQGDLPPRVVPHSVWFSYPPDRAVNSRLLGAHFGQWAELNFQRRA